MSIRSTHTVGRLASDMERIPEKAVRSFKKTVRQAVVIGNTEARDNARRSSGTHGKHYPKSFTWEMRPHFAMFGASIFSGEYGPEAGRLQGSMATGFEGGSRNQPPHRDLAKSADLIGPAFANEVASEVGGLYW